MIKRTLPVGLLKRQEEARQETVLKIQTAIDTLKAEGSILDIKSVMKLTNYSRSTFGKKHVVDVLRKNQVGPYRDKISIIQEQNALSLVKRLENELSRANRKISNYTKDLERLRKSYYRIKTELLQTQNDYQLLLGKWHTLLKLAKIQGLNLESLIN